jgi:hypothetical protein
MVVQQTARRSLCRRGDKASVPSVSRCGVSGRVRGFDEWSLSYSQMTIRAGIHPVIVDVISLTELSVLDRYKSDGSS